MRNVIFIFLLGFVIQLNAQEGYWQQGVDYNMEIDFDVTKHQFKGNQTIVYSNNSPDTLYKVFYHLYFNAFQPGSMMDERSLTIADPDRRVGDRISKLAENEIGYQKVLSLTQNNKKLNYHVEGTTLEVELAEPMMPGSKATFVMKFEGQVPLQIRRSGRDNDEGVAYSMTQWYPKLAEYDYMGWHANPYIAREFHGIWGDFDVTINIASDYVLGATGVLQNAEEIGHGYESKDRKVIQKPNTKNKWHFVAENVIDFAWVADPDFNHISKIAHDGTMLHFIYQPNEQTSENWAKLPVIMDEALKYMNANYGKYQFPQYTFIQGGDGGMEYPMITLITGERSLTSLVGVCVHEWMHSWYQFTLATNESLYAWMDEGFTSFASSEVMNHLKSKGLIPGQPVEDPHIGTTVSYAMFNQSGYEEPLSIHSDHFTTNTAYGRGAYTKGSVYLSQLEYVIGEVPFRHGLLRYFNTWKFKHPTPISLLRIMEKESGLELDWYNEYFVYTTKSIDYGVKSVVSKDKKAIINLERVGDMPMPVEAEIEYIDGTKTLHYIPMVIMRGEKHFSKNTAVVKEKDWPWTHRNYSFEVDKSIDQISSVTLFPSGRVADVNQDNNVYSADKK